MRDRALLLLLSSTAMPEREEIGDILDCFTTFGHDDGSIIISFRNDPGWYGAVDVPPLEEVLKMRVPIEDHRVKYERLRDVHLPPPRVLGRRGYGRLDFRKGR